MHMTKEKEKEKKEEEKNMRLSLAPAGGAAQANNKIPNNGGKVRQGVCDAS